MALRPGIEENINITGLVIDEQYGNFQVVVARLEAPAVEEEEDEFEALMNGGTGKASVSQFKEESKLRIYGVKTEKYGQPLDSAAVSKEFILFQATLRHLLVQGKLAEQYNQVAQKDRAKFLLDFIKFPKTQAFMKEQGVTRETVEGKFQDEQLVEAISKSYFQEAAQKLVEEEVAGKPLRGIFIRQSEAKHYPALRAAKFDENFFINGPVFEREDLVPAEKSKLKFSKYELEKGLNNPDKVEADATPSGTAGVDQLFS